MSGLTRRNVARNLDTESNDDKFNSKNEENQSDKEKSDAENDEYDADSKETRLTLMEEILLLGLKDREVISIYFCVWSFKFCLTTRKKF